MSGSILSRAKYAVVTPDRGLALLLPLAVKLQVWRRRLRRREQIALSRAPRENADIVVYGFDRAHLDDAGYVEHQLARIVADAARIKIVMQLASPAIHGPERAEIDRKNAVVETIARRVGAHMVMTAEVMHNSAARMFATSGLPNLRGYAALGHAVLGRINTQMVRSSVASAPEEAAPGGPAAKRPGRRKAKSAGATLPSADEVLSAMSWNSPRLPANLSSYYSPEAISAFANNSVFFASFRGWGKVALGEPIDWAMEGTNWSWQSYFTGLEFVRPPMALWYDSVSGHEGRPGPKVLESLRKLGTTPEKLLTRARAVVVDFLEKNPPSSPKNQRAYFQGTILRRVKVLLTHLICAKRAAELGTPFDRAEVGAVFNALVQSFEMLKSDQIYPVAGNHGGRQDVLFIVTGLLWHRLPYGRELLDLGMRRLKRFQLDMALSPDGVWLENSFGYHCSMMNQFPMTARDLRTAGAPEARSFCTMRSGAWRRSCRSDGQVRRRRAAHRRHRAAADKFRLLARDECARTAPATNAARTRDLPPRQATPTCFLRAGYFASHTNRDARSGTILDPDLLRQLSAAQAQAVRRSLHRSSAMVPTTSGRRRHLQQGNFRHCAQRRALRSGDAQYASASTARAILAGVPGTQARRYSTGSGRARAGRRRARSTPPTPTAASSASSSI